MHKNTNNGNRFGARTFSSEFVKPVSLSTYPYCRFVMHQYSDQYINISTTINHNIALVNVVLYIVYRLYN